MIDLLCEDYERAAQNRQRIKDGYAVAYWLWYEAMVRRYSYSYLLPEDLPQGELIYLSKRDAKHLKKHGYHSTSEVIK
jgi:hypothetical protein